MSIPSPTDTETRQANQAWQDGPPSRLPHGDLPVSVPITGAAFGPASSSPPAMSAVHAQLPATMLFHPSIATGGASHRNGDGVGFDPYAAGAERNNGKRTSHDTVRNDGGGGAANNEARAATEAEPQFEADAQPTTLFSPATGGWNPFGSFSLSVPPPPSSLAGRSRYAPPVGPPPSVVSSVRLFPSHTFMSSRHSMQAHGSMSDTRAHKSNRQANGEKQKTAASTKAAQRGQDAMPGNFGGSNAIQQQQHPVDASLMDAMQSLQFGKHGPGDADGPIMRDVRDEQRLMPVPTVDGHVIQQTEQPTYNNHPDARMPNPASLGAPLLDHAQAQGMQNDAAHHAGMSAQAHQDETNARHLAPFSSDRAATPRSAAPATQYRSPYVASPSERSTPLAGHRVPASTCYPSTLQSNKWTDTNSVVSQSSDGTLKAGTIASSTAADPRLRGKHRRVDAVRAIREGLGWLPAKYLEEIDRNELQKLVLKAIEGRETLEAGSGQPWTADGAGVFKDAATQNGRRTSSFGSWQGTEGEFNRSRRFSDQPTSMPYTREHVTNAAPSNAHEWFEQLSGQKLPPGWTAEYDYQQQAWYYVNNNVNPPITTWDDPCFATAAATAAAPMPSAPQPAQMFGGSGWTGDSFYPYSPYSPGGMPWSSGTATSPDYLNDPATARAYADWYAKTFAGFQAYRQFMENEKGPVAAELDTERKRVRRLARAQSLIQEASRRLREATTGSPSPEKERERQAAEVDLARAQGMMDRLHHEDAQRSKVVPPWLANYQGVTRGYEYPSERQRTHYVDAAPAMPLPTLPASLMNAGPMGPSMPISQWPPQGAPPPLGMGMPMSPYNQALPMPLAPPPGAAQHPGARIPGSMNTPTVFPVPPGMRAKGSTVPTPYGLPEACFAWDMLLRSTTATDKLAARPNYRGYGPTPYSTAAAPMMPPMTGVPGAWPNGGAQAPLVPAISSSRRTHSSRSSKSHSKKQDVAV